MTTGKSRGTRFRTLDEAVEIAESLAPKLRERVDRAEQLRRLPEETVADLIESGLLGIETPRRWGGPELSLDALLEVTGALAQGCPSTGWVYALWASHVWLIGQFPEHIQAQVFSDPGVRISSVINTEGEAERVDGGFRWSGRGYFCSGVDYCEWLTAALDVPATARGPPERLWMLVPRSDFEIVDDWHTIGLVGTGSKSIVLDNVFIPDERIVNGQTLSQGDGYGATLHGSPLYCAAVDFTFSLPLPAAELGIAKAAVQEFQALCRERLEGGSRHLAAEQAATLMRFALASAEVEAAHTLLLADARRFCSVSAKEATALDRAQCRRDVSFATQMCRRAVNSLFEAAGAFDAYRPSNLQRLWRDSNVAAAHHGLMWDIHGLSYGRLAAGLSATLDPVGL